jgi:RimJ/RimL family protein N-acetyltransferase
VANVIPDPTERLRFREMAESDLDLFTVLLSDPDVMRHYPSPKTREEALAWIKWSEDNYAQHGHGLWVIETHDGEFVGDCGLTWQPVEGEQVLEVGYHVSPDLQGRGYATEAARACLAHAHEQVGEDHVVAIMVRDNTPSRRVAEKIGMTLELETEHKGVPVVVYGVHAGR